MCSMGTESMSSTGDSQEPGTEDPGTEDSGTVVDGAATEEEGKEVVVGIRDGGINIVVVVKAVDLTIVSKASATFFPSNSMGAGGSS
mmetsp:Transcript_11268/g.25128  ORF Transcript_11268/g.25128 Transcript_11268/m.25128 type:complete len:87 (-) Transcript_11268:624-884(-)